ncbi:MAG: WD40 repeat domain-containing protein [Scytonema sp. PMC 1070.18]|nr:WD40 repeat domain-containing protein [Scytonema sp. PMC 1070.18]
MSKIKQKLTRNGKLVDGEKLHTFPEQHRRGVTSIAFSPDGETLISGGRDQTIKVWRRLNSKSR